MAQILVSDTNIWIDFHRVNKLEDLFKLPYQFITTDFVFEELKEPSGKVLRKLGLKIVSQSNDEISSIIQLRQLHTKPSLSDLSCFHYAQTHNHVLLTGDSALRQLSENVRMEVHGTLWLLDELVTHKVMKKTGASTCLKAMCDNGSFLPIAECEKRFKRWK